MKVNLFMQGKIRRFRGILPPMGSVGSSLDANHLLRMIHQLCEEVSIRFLLIYTSREHGE